MLSQLTNLCSFDFLYIFLWYYLAFFILSGQYLVALAFHWTKLGNPAEPLGFVLLYSFSSA